jgi:DNA-binding NarL/FixJ family response regulator
LFEPIAEALGVETLTQERIAQHVRRYFHDVIVSLSADDAAREMAKLTHREHEILNLLSKGYVDKEIAEALGISVWTVHGHLKKVFEKLGVHTRTEAAIKYLHK